MNRKKVCRIITFFCVALLIHYQFKAKVFVLANVSSSAVERVDGGITAVDREYSISDYIEKNEWKNVDEQKDVLIESALADADTKKVPSAKKSQLTLGEPFVIYYPDIDQPAVHYYPVVYQDKVVYTVDVVATNDETSYGISEEFVDLLNDIDYLNMPAVFYYCNGKIYAENKEKKIDPGIHFSLDYEGMDEKVQREFYGKTYQEKSKIICKDMQNFQPVDVLFVDESNKDFATERFHTELTLHNPMGQYDQGMCWAAAAATIINFEHKSGITAYNVCNTMNIGYSAGGTIYDIQSALEKYSVNDYDRIANGAVSWSKLKSNIDGANLLAAGGYDETYGTRHVVTILGYNSSAGTYKIWNSANNNGSGGYGTRTYSTGICAVVAGVPYTWVSTLYVC